MHGLLLYSQCTSHVAQCVSDDVMACVCVFRNNGIVSAYRNDLRQVHVNHVADYIGSGIGTGRFYGVPGTNGHYGNYGGYGYGHNGGY